MQNKGIVIVMAVLMTLASIFYLSFSFATKYYDSEAAKLKDPVAQQDYKDSVKYLGIYSYQKCLETQIGLGLDLKGGMNVILEVSVPDVVETLADHKTDAAFVKSMKEAKAEEETSQKDFITLFIKAYHKNAPGHRLAEVFATQQMQGKVSAQSSDSEVEKALRAECSSAIDNSFNVVRTRIDKFGVVQPNIQKLEGQEGRIMVEMPGIREPERMRKLLQGSANLEFWETYTLGETMSSLTALDKRLAGADAKDSAAADSTKAKAAKAKSAAEQHPLFSKLIMMQGMQPTNCVVGYAIAKDTAAINAMVNSEAAKSILPADLKLAWGVKNASGMKANVFELYALRANNGQPSMQGDVIADAKDEFDQNHRPIVSMTMTTSGARDWATLTKKNLKKCVAIVLDGYVYSAPVVQNEITGGNSQISGNFTTDDTRDLANVLKSGKMPAPTKIVQEETVGPSLGAASIQAGFTACVVAFVLLMVFMCCFYGLIPGMVANVALILNFFFTFGILTSFQAALTMSGIAGMVLSLGMAVDANVLIYERTKEELKAGKGIKTALAEGYGNAFSAIFDSNLTSIITAVILYNFGTGPIRGFAMTLGIGIVCSFFTAVWVSRIVFEHFLNKDKWLGLTFTTGMSKNFLSNANVNFMKMGRRSIYVFIIGAVIAIGFLATRGLSSGIDFTGGRNYVIEFEQKGVTPEQVQKAVAAKVNAKDPNASVSAIAITTTSNAAVRLSTNYRIDDDNESIDQDVEHFIYDALHEAKLIKADYNTFIDRDNHTGGSIISAQKVGPTVANDMVRGAITAVLLSLAAIFVYILIRFRNVAFSVGSVVALVFDTLLVVGVYSICWGWIGFSLEVDQTFIGAILTVIGYSINDKVVVFDRMRENLQLHPRMKYFDLFNMSLNSTLTRTVMTSATTFLVLLCIFILGGDSIRSFAFAMILGVIFGTLSSIFLAAPIAYRTLSRKQKGEEEKIC